jgi:predicted RNA-binding Zn-ribbon protein involved in translation (DUF1610 family)
MSEVKCSNCRSPFELGSGVGYFCDRECQRAYNRTYRERNRERCNEAAKRYAERNRGRIRMRQRLGRLRDYDEDIKLNRPDCKRCGDPVPVRKYGSAWAVYCSQRCRDGVEKGKVKKCRYCYNDFVCTRRDQLFCDDMCRYENHKQANRLKGWVPVGVSDCAWCGHSFLGEGDCCSDFCKAKAVTHAKGIFKRVFLRSLWGSVRVRSCLECGSGFTPRDTRGRFCSPKCSKRFWRRNSASRKHARKAYRNRRKARIKGNRNNEPTSIPRKLLSGVDCFYCGRSYDASFHVNHFIPVSKGGPEAAWNLRSSCSGCNLEKSDQLPWEFYRNRQTTTQA